MPLRTLSWLAAAALAVAVCGGGAPEVVTPDRGSGAGTSTLAVFELIEHLNAPDFAAASDLVVPGQAALATLAEGATFSEVADAIEDGDAQVASNFWAGFAQGAGAFLVEGVDVQDGETVVEGDLEFHLVSVDLGDEGKRTIMTRDVDGHRIDLFASFGGGLAERMIAPVERLLSANTEAAATILPELKTIVPSLLVAANQPDVSPSSVQDLLRLVELITRIN